MKCFIRVIKFFRPVVIIQHAVASNSSSHRVIPHVQGNNSVAIIFVVINRTPVDNSVHLGRTCTEMILKVAL